MKRRSEALLLAAAPGVVALLALGTAQPAGAQSRQLQNRLESATRVVCTFSALAMADWDDATPKATIESAEVEVEFHDINVDEGTAEAGGDFGDSFISVRYSHGYLHFMQISDVGPLYVTTILAQESVDGRLKAIQTRLDYPASSLPAIATRPEMYVGDCEVTS